MADHDPKFDASIIRRNVDAARGADLLDQLSQTTSESVGGTADLDECEGFDIIFEREEAANDPH